MADHPAYDLFVLLDLESADEQRARVVEQVRNQLQTSGGLKNDVDWGTRRLAYEIDHRGEAQYHLFQFEAEAGLLRELDRALSIDDAVLRHRIIRLPGEAPETPPRPSPDEPRRSEDRDRDRGDRGRGDRGRDRGPRGPETGGDQSEGAGGDALEPPATEPTEQAPAPEAQTPAAEAPAAETPAAEEPAPPPAEAG